MEEKHIGLNIIDRGDLTDLLETCLGIDPKDFLSHTTAVTMAYEDFDRYSVEGQEDLLETCLFEDNEQAVLSLFPALAEVPVDKRKVIIATRLLEIFINRVAPSQAQRLEFWKRQQNSPHKRG